MISQFFILSPRGDTIIYRDFRGDVPSDAIDIFFGKVKYSKGEVPPIFNQSHVNYLHIKKNGLYLTLTTRCNTSPSYLMEFLNRISRLIKDYCGVLTEESIRKNFVLIYEVLDEACDFGVPQNTSTEVLKSYVFNEPVPVEGQSNISSLFRFATDRKTLPSTAVQKPIAMIGERKSSVVGRKNEIFVDILERITALFTSQGTVLNAEIDGSIQMKSYLNGNPMLRLALNEELVIKSHGQFTGGYGVVALDDCNFHESVDLSEFESQRTLTFHPPDGEFTVMNYRIKDNDMRLPFKVHVFVQELGTYVVEVILKIRAEIPSSNFGANVIVMCPLPKNTSSCKFDMPNSKQVAEYEESKRTMKWNVKKFPGSSEQELRAKVTLTSPLSNIQQFHKDFGPVSMTFEVPMYNISDLQVRYLHVVERTKTITPYRWVRYISKSDSYVCRVVQ
eukprot:TRINITY_DN2184_c0_g1::TRINITY_DN2184_c0_g1_i1::g.12760::m.12760 TRINITY_DN2184_c0_g1::TRINITY_DN2184_c0_g1_i1::g.12760  ORF type:complete len:447 (-),score=96.71,sp/Q9SB50/AP4M_ARATH/49.89/2e-150,Adap_comp_sub/PF00928.16/5.6e-70,Clat_adaptor_s/PF01217.15/0.26,Clat_adaptor_s/PF01217.15/1.9e+03 TRINITY_DN2184_c0_g1_i1:712-2052(-)